MDPLVRILIYNIHKGIGWGTIRHSIAHIHDRFKELHPDIILLQEIRGTQFKPLAADIWSHFSYGKNAVYPKGHHGNAILSKFPILTSQNIDLSMHRYEQRGLLHSIIDLNDKGKLHLCCVHLGLFRKDRKKQLDRIVEFIKNEIPDNEPLILGGDFNDWNCYATIPLVHEAGLEEAFLNSHKAYAKTFPAWAPVFRLDRLYFRGFHVSRAHRLNQKTWRYLSDHIALEVELHPTF